MTKDLYTLFLGDEVVLGDFVKLPSAVVCVGGEAVRYVPERTCRNDSLKRGKGVFTCSECGVYLDIADMDWDGEDDGGGFYEPSYCPNCGARVKEESR